MFYENHHNFFPCSLFFYLNKKVFCLNIEVHFVQQNDSLKIFIVLEIRQEDLFEFWKMPVHGVADLVEALVLLHLEVPVVVKRVLLEEEPDLVAGVQEVPIFGLKESLDCGEG